LHGWEAIFEWSDGLDRLNEAIWHGLVWLTTTELLDLSRHIPLTAEYCAPGHRRTVHDIAAVSDDTFRHEDSGGIETATQEGFTRAFPDGGQPIWKLLSAPNPPPVFVAPNWPVSPQPPVKQVSYSLAGALV
jgi:hypothetical protein